MTPGLKEKLTTPMTPRKPANTLTNPVVATPRVIRIGILSGLRSPLTA